MNKSSPEFAAALSQVSAEFERMTAGRIDSMSAKDTVELRDYARAHTDLKKQDADLTDEEGAWKVVYQALDDALQKSLEPDKKAEVDGLAESRYQLFRLRDAVGVVADLGPHIEELLIRQLDRIVFHHNDDENDYRPQERRLTKTMLDDRSPLQVRTECAESLIRLADRYLEFFVKPLQSLNDAIDRQLIECEKPIASIDESAILDASASQVAARLRRWVALSQELNAARRGTTEAILRQITFDKRFPARVLQTGATAKTQLSAEESQQFVDDATAYATLGEKSYLEAKRIQAERDPLVRELFPREEGLPEQPQEQRAPGMPQPVPRGNSLEARGWYRLMKVMYIILCVGAGLFTLLVGWLGTIETALVVGVVSAALLALLRIGFFYVTLGRTSAAEPMGSGFADVDDLRADFAKAQAIDPRFYVEVIAPTFDSWQKQYGRRVPQHALQLLQQRIDQELDDRRRKKREVIDKITREGAVLKIVDLRDRFEKDKANYTGPNPIEYARQLDHMLMTLEAKYGSEIPFDEADKLVDQLDEDTRQHEAR